MSQEEITQAYAAAEPATAPPPSIKQVIDEVLEVLHESISEHIEYSVPEVNMTAQYRQSSYAQAGHERCQVNISFLWGLDGEGMFTPQTFYSQSESLAACITDIHHQIAEFTAAIKTGLA